MKDLFEMSKGNPGALVCLMNMYKFTKQDDLLDAIKIIVTLNDYNIVGSDIYVMFNDLSNKNYKTMRLLCEKVPKNDLIDACSRQDYSGIEIVKPYLL